MWHVRLTRLQAHYFCEGVRQRLVRPLPVTGPWVRSATYSSLLHAMLLDVYDADLPSLPGFLEVRAPLRMMRRVYAVRHGARLSLDNGDILQQLSPYALRILSLHVTHGPQAQPTRTGTVVCSLLLTPIPPRSTEVRWRLVRYRSQLAVLLLTPALCP